MGHQTKNIIKVTIPKSFFQEKEYIITTLLEDFLGFRCTLDFHEKDTYEIILENEKKIIIQDAFWKNFDEKTGYLSENNIPNKIEFAKSRYAPEQNIPIIYGTTEIRTEPNEIYCGIDIFASSFFMLTRWEEYVIKQKDKHNRFPCELSLAQRNNIHYRPVVNEYVFLLKNMLESLLQKKIDISKHFEIIPTHDVDQIYRYKNIFSLFRSLAGDLAKRKSIKTAAETAKKYLAVKKGQALDPYDTFDFLMDISEKHNLKSRFYFIAGEKGDNDFRYQFLSDKVGSIINKIRSREHIVGIHGSYDSYDNESVFYREVNRFKHYGIEVKEGRQHYLRFKNPETWRIWEQNKMQYDSTMGYSNDGGFRCGVCYEFNVFDILKRQKLNLKERPLIVMEVALRQKYNSTDEFIKNFIALKKKVKQYNGQFVFLWHPNNFNTPYWTEYAKFYENILE